MSSKFGNEKFILLLEETKKEEKNNININNIEYKDIYEAEKLKKFNKFKKNIDYYMFKTEYEGNTGIAIIYKFDYSEDKSTNTFFVQTVMDIIKFLENALIGIDYTSLIRELEDTSKSISLLVCFKKI